MKDLFIILAFWLAVSAYQVEAQNPALINEKGAYRLLVDGMPFLMLSGELHNSTSSSPQYMTPVWEKLKSMHLNSVIASIAWEQFEPEEGKYNYSLVDSILEQAHRAEMKVALIWFASWKNGVSSYTPVWVKKDVKRFFRTLNSKGEMTHIISPTCTAARDADAKAFAALMKYIKEHDRQKTVILMQAENEVGVFGGIDNSPQAQKLFNESVPDALIKYLIDNENTLEKQLKAVWLENGKKTKGNWTEVFGDNCNAREFFLAAQYALYIGKIVEKGKAEYNIPVYINAWLEQYRDEQPDYPIGGPIAKVMDIYRALAPAIDWYAPDIYLPTFREICSQYKRHDNPLFIPESSRDAGRAYYAFAELDALCFAPFGIEDSANDAEFIAAYALLEGLLPAITQAHGTGKMRGFYRQQDERNTYYTVGDYKIDVVYPRENEPGYGLLIQTAPEEFLVAGYGAHVHISSSIDGQKSEIATVIETKYENNCWYDMRWLNGDETQAHGFVGLGEKKSEVRTPGAYRVTVVNYPTE